MTVAIVSLAARGNGDEIAVLFEMRRGEDCQRERLLISSSDLADLGLRVGECSSACFDAVLAVSERYAARKRALAMLGYGRCSARRLAQKLSAKGVDRAVARETVERLSAEGYLDGGEDALREAQRDAAKLWGEKRIAADLRAKGYEDEAVRWALSELEESGVDYVSSCVRRMERMSGEIFSDDPNERQKCVAALTRAGFSLSEIREAAQRLSDGE